MDANNIAWVVSKHQEGYPPGGFYGRVLNMIFSPPLDARDRLWQLVDIFNRADETRTRGLQAVLPGVRLVLLQLYHLDDGMDEARALETLAATLQILPHLLARMPEVAGALDEYQARGLAREAVAPSKMPPLLGL